MIESTNPKSFFGACTKMLAQFKLPGTAVAAMLDSRRRDIGALVAANTAALAGIQALGMKQAEILRTTTTEVQLLVTPSAPSETKPTGNKGELVRQGLYKALANVQDLSGIAYQAQSDTIAAISKRVAENVEELKALVQTSK